MHRDASTATAPGPRGRQPAMDATPAPQTSLSGHRALPALRRRAGALFIAAWRLFALGFAWRIYRFRKLTRPTAAPVATSRPLPKAMTRPSWSGGKSRIRAALFKLRRWERGTSTAPARDGAGEHPLPRGLVPRPLLLPAHNILFRQSLGFSLPSLPEPVLDVATLVLLAIGAFFCCAGSSTPACGPSRPCGTTSSFSCGRAVRDRLHGLPQWLDYRTVLVAHMLIGEVVIAAIPFTSWATCPSSSSPASSCPVSTLEARQAQVVI